MALFKRVRVPSEDLDPKDYGFGVRKMPKVTDAQIGDLYLRTKQETGQTIPELEKYLGALASATETINDLPTPQPE